MEAIALAIFLLVYLGMMLGSWPGLALDRTGIALLGGIAFIGLQGISVTQAASYVDLPALTILFSFMIISAQFYYSGFYTHLIERMEKWNLSPSYLLFVVIMISAGLSAILINDIVCLALTPLVIKVCFWKKLKPIPFLLGLACASNIGSALTLIGNPQNLLIGQVLSIPFFQYLQFSFVPCFLGLLALWFIIKLFVKEKWAAKEHPMELEVISYKKWESLKGIIVIVLLLLVFLLTDLPRDKASLAAAGFLLLSRRMASHTMLSFIDWQLLVLFIGLFIVNRSFLSMSESTSIAEWIKNYQMDHHSTIWIIPASFILSNIVSNVPSVMLLLPFVQTQYQGTLLALSSTLAGNFFIVGSIANLIMISQAARYGIIIDWKTHMKIGIPVTLTTLIITLLWIYL